MDNPRLPPTQTPSLYGINSSNRQPDEFWGKNQFNNVFPMALACWMRDNKVPCVQVAQLNQRTVHTEISISELFGLEDAEHPHFDFEATFADHQRLSHSPIPRVDVVISTTSTTPVQQRRALEIKLVVVPDSTTFERAESEWAPEIVFRPSTSTNCIMRMYRNLIKSGAERPASQILRTACRQIHDWGNPVEMSEIAPSLVEAMSEILQLTEEQQTPIIACTVWRTEGMTPVLSKNAFDIFAWTDSSFMQMLCSRCLEAKRGGIGRPLRTTLRSVRILHELLLTKEVDIPKIVSTMSFDRQDDKDFAISGSQTISMMKHPRLRTPIVPRTALSEIILGSGIEHLSPERRLDATLYFAYKYGFGGK